MCLVCPTVQCRPLLTPKPLHSIKKSTSKEWTETSTVVIVIPFLILFFIMYHFGHLIIDYFVRVIDFSFIKTRLTSLLSNKGEGLY